MYYPSRVLDEVLLQNLLFVFCFPPVFWVMHTSESNTVQQLISWLWSWLYADTLPIPYRLLKVYHKYTSWRTKHLSSNVRDSWKYWNFTMEIISSSRLKMWVYYSCCCEFIPEVLTVSSVKSCAHIRLLLRQNQNTFTRLDEKQFLYIRLRKHEIWVRNLTKTSFKLPFLFKYNRKNDWFIIAHHMLPFDSLIWYALTTTKLWHGWMRRKDSYFLWGMVYSEQCQ